MVRRLLVGFAEELELDGAGRVLISPSLRQYAGLEKEIWLIGQGRHFEIWSDAGWKAAAGCDLRRRRQAAASGPGKPCVVNADLHVSVLLTEAVAALAIRRTGVYVDATFGRGGHSRRSSPRSGRGG
jgi:hypothetical protein